MDSNFEYNRYFENFDDLKAALDIRRTLPGIGKRGCDVVRAASYLLWSGFTKDQIMEVRYCHLRDDCIEDEWNGCFRTLPAEGMEFLKEYANNRADFGYFGTDGFLLRTFQKRHLERTTLYGAFTKVNSDIPLNCKLLYPIPIYESGVFNRVWNLEQQGFVLPVYRRNRALTDDGYMLYEKVFERTFVSKNAITNYVKRYRSYTEFFHNTKPTI